MKRYYNETTKEWYFEGKTITRRLESGALFSGIPTLSQLSEWGFVEIVAPEPTPEEQLEIAKQRKIQEIEDYNVSDAVNEFSINNNPMWLTVEERQQIATQINVNEAVDRTSMTRWFNGQEFTFPLTTWKQMLTALELYAGDALNVTEAHKAEVMTLTTIQEIDNYDITDGYPNKLNF